MFSRKVLTKVLGDMGPGKVRHAINGEQALTIMIEAVTPFDLVLTDIMMPGMDGFDLIQRIRWDEAPGHKDVPIIVLTGKDPEKNAARAEDFDISAFLIKPPRPDQLRAAIEKALNL